MTGIVIAILVSILFLLDLIFGLIPGMKWLAPFKYAGGLMLDMIFVLSAAAVGYLSWLTLREQD